MVAAGITNWGFIYSNLGTPATANIGTSITPGTSNSEGAWTQVASSANISQDIYFIVIWVCGGNSTGAIKDHLLDIGSDVLGGTNYSALISNVSCGASDAALNGGRWYQFPIFIKNGSTVAVRIQGSNATAGTVRVAISFYGQLGNPVVQRSGQYSETIGTIASSAGVSFTPGNSGAESTVWTLLGTTTRPLWYFQLGIGCSNSTITSLMYYFDLAVGDTVNKSIIIQDYAIFIRGTAETLASNLVSGYFEVPANSSLWVRGSCSGTGVTGWHALAIGIGG